MGGLALNILPTAPFAQNTAQSQCCETDNYYPLIHLLATTAQV